MDEANAKIRLEQKAAQAVIEEQQAIVAARERKVREAEEEREKQEYQARVEQEAKAKAEREAAEAKAKAEQEAVERSRQETAEAVRIEAERPDKEKLDVYGQEITSLMFAAPTVKAKRVQAKLDKVIILLGQATDLIE